MIPWEGTVILDLFSSGTLIGSVVRSHAGTVFAYTPSGTALGCYGDIDAAAAALAALVDRREAA